LRHDLAQLAPALFGQCRHRHAQQIALRAGFSEVDSRIAFSIFPAMPFSQGCTLIVRDPGGSRWRPADRHHRAVVVDLHLVENPRVGAAVRILCSSF